MFHLPFASSFWPSENLNNALSVPPAGILLLKFKESLLCSTAASAAEAAASLLLVFLPCYIKVLNYLIKVSNIEVSTCLCRSRGILAVWDFCQLVVKLFIQSWLPDII